MKHVVLKKFCNDKSMVGVFLAWSQSVASVGKKEDFLVCAVAMAPKVFACFLTTLVISNLLGTLSQNSKIYQYDTFLAQTKFPDHCINFHQFYQNKTLTEMLEK